MMNSNRPYLIRALYEWLVDNGMTPHLLVDAEYEGVDVPQQFVEDGRIVLNINPSAVIDLRLDNELISFNARFGGRETEVFVPPLAVLGIYSRENGRGMLFPEELEEDMTTDEDDDPQPPKPPKGGRPSLKVVK